MLPFTCVFPISNFFPEQNVHFYCDRQGFWLLLLLRHIQFRWSKALWISVIFYGTTCRWLIINTLFRQVLDCAVEAERVVIQIGVTQEKQMKQTTTKELYKSRVSVGSTCCLHVSGWAFSTKKLWGNSKRVYAPFTCKGNENPSCVQWSGGFRVFMCVCVCVCVFAGFLLVYLLLRWLWFGTQDLSHLSEKLDIVKMELKNQ